MPTIPNHILALDVGSKRIGLALASGIARLARPLTTLDADGDVIDQLARIITDEKVEQLVVGLPRNLDGQETAQTASVRSFTSQLEQFKLPIHLQDEALTSHKAEAELAARGKAYNKADVDALAATYILEDYLATDATEVDS